MGKLTALSVKAATEPGTYGDGDGLMLVVKSSGARSWILRTLINGKRRDIGIGSAAIVSLAEARAKAGDLRKLARSGIDPIAQREAEKRARAVIPTFRVAAKQCHEENLSTWRNAKHQAQWLSTLETYAFGKIGDTRVDMIDAPMIRDVLLPIWLSKPETARRVRQRIRTVMHWAASHGHRLPLDLSVMDAGMPRQPRRDRHFAAMPYDHVPAFVAALQDAPETVGRLALLFTVATAARSGEVRGATWPEIDLEAAIWTIPAERMKGAREHVIPLSPFAVSILSRARHYGNGKSGCPIFPGRKGQPLSDMSISKVLRDMGLSVTVHGFRSAFKDWASEASSFPDAVSEAALAHVDANKTRAAYRRTDFLAMRRDMMAAWGAFIAPPAANVANLDKARRRKRLTG